MSSTSAVKKTEKLVSITLARLRLPTDAEDEADTSKWKIVARIFGRLKGNPLAVLHGAEEASNFLNDNKKSYRLASLERINAWINGERYKEAVRKATPIRITKLVDEYVGLSVGEEIHLYEDLTPVPPHLIDGATVFLLDVYNSFYFGPVSSVQEASAEIDRARKKLDRETSVVRDQQDQIAVKKSKGPRQR